MTFSAVRKKNAGCSAKRKPGIAGRLKQPWRPASTFAKSYLTGTTNWLFVRTAFTSSTFIKKSPRYSKRFSLLLIKNIPKRILPDCVVYMDCLASDDVLEVCCFKHCLINHSKLFADRKNNINDIETSGIRHKASFAQILRYSIFTFIWENANSDLTPQKQTSN